MESENKQRSWDRMADIAEAGDVSALVEFVDGLGPSEVFRALLRLDAARREKVLTTLTPDSAADLIEEFPEEHAAHMIEEIPPENAAEILSEMSGDEQADVVAGLHAENAEAILAAMEADQAREIRSLTSYDPETAGGLMQTSVLCLPESGTVRDARKMLVEREDDGEELHLYLVSPAGRLVGSLEMQALAAAAPGVLLSDIATTAVHVTPELSFRHLQKLFQREGFSSVPVVDIR